MGLIFLYETTGVADADGTTVPIRFSTGRGYNHATGPGFFEPCIIGASDGLRVTQSIFADRRSFGFGQRDFGFVEVLNEHGALDELVEYGYGQPATVKLGDADSDYLGFTTVMAGIANQVLPDVGRIKIGWRDRIDELEEPLQSAVFAGTNDGLNGLEGTPEDIGGQRKPYTGGRVRNHPPTLLNASQRILGWRWGRNGQRLPTQTVAAVRVNGILWQSAGNVADAAALATVNPTQGQYVTCLAESLVKLGGSLPQGLGGLVSIDATIEADSADRTAAGQMLAILRAMGIPGERISAADLEGLLPFEVQVSVQDQSAREVMDAIMASVLACGWIDYAGQYRFGQIQPLTVQEPVARFKRLRYGSVQGPNDVDITAIGGVFSGSADKDVPVHEVRVRYGRNGLVLSGTSLADAVGPDEAARIGQEYQTTEPATSPATLAKYSNASTLTHDTLLLARADAETVRDLLLALLSQNRLTLSLTVRLEPETAARLSVGGVVEVMTDFYGMENGRLGQILSYELGSKNNKATLQLWMAAHG